LRHAATPHGGYHNPMWHGTAMWSWHSTEQPICRVVQVLFFRQKLSEWWCNRKTTERDKGSGQRRLQKRLWLRQRIDTKQVKSVSVFAFRRGFHSEWKCGFYSVWLLREFPLPASF